MRRRRRRPRGTLSGPLTIRWEEPALPGERAVRLQELRERGLLDQHGRYVRRGDIAPRFSLD